MQFETDGGAVGSTVISQISAGRKNRLWLELDGGEEALVFNQEEPESLWVGRREAATLIKRDPEALSPPAARYATIPAGHPQGYNDCFDAFVAEVYAAVATAASPPTACRSSPTACAPPRLTDAVLASAREERWVDVAAPAAPARRLAPYGSNPSASARSRSSVRGDRVEVRDLPAARSRSAARSAPPVAARPRSSGPRVRDRRQRRAPVALVRLAPHEARALEPVDDVGHRRPVDLQPVAHLAQRQRAAAAVVQEHQRLVARERQVERA